MSAAEVNDVAIAMLNAGRSAEAAVGFRQVLRLKASNEATAAAYFNLGIAFKDLARHQDSAVAYLSALRLRPAFPQAHFNLGRSFQIMADDPGPAGYLRRHAARRESQYRPWYGGGRRGRERLSDASAVASGAPPPVAAPSAAEPPYGAS